MSGVVIAKNKITINIFKNEKKKHFANNKNMK